MNIAKFFSVPFLIFLGSFVSTAQGTSWEKTVDQDTPFTFNFKEHNPNTTDVISTASPSNGTIIQNPTSK